MHLIFHNCKNKEIDNFFNAFSFGHIEPTQEPDLLTECYEFLKYFLNKKNSSDPKEIFNLKM